MTIIRAKEVSRLRLSGLGKAAIIQQVGAPGHPGGLFSVLNPNFTSAQQPDFSGAGSRKKCQLPVRTLL
jgi:hypothetical protein